MFFFKIQDGKEEGIKSYMAICLPYVSSTLAVKKYLDGSTDIYMQEFYINSQAVFMAEHKIYNQLHDAIESLRDRARRARTCYILRLTAFPQEVYDAIIKGKFSEVVKDALDLHDYKMWKRELFITKDAPANMCPPKNGELI